MLKVIVRGIKDAENVKAVTEAGVDGVTFVTESKEDPANLDITEVTETARLAPPLLNVIIETTTLEEARLRRAIGSAHPHVAIVPAELDPMILADLQVSFPDVKWFARLAPTEYEPFHDAADALVFKAADAEDATRVKEATRTRIVLEDVTEKNAADAVAAVQPFAIMIQWTDVDTLVRTVAAARAAHGE